MLFTRNYSPSCAAESRLTEMAPFPCAHSCSIYTGPDIPHKAWPLFFRPRSHDPGVYSKKRRNIDAAASWRWRRHTHTHKKVSQNKVSRSPHMHFICSRYTYIGSECCSGCCQQYAALWANGAKHTPKLGQRQIVRGVEATSSLSHRRDQCRRAKSTEKLLIDFSLKLSWVSGVKIEIPMTMVAKISQNPLGYWWDWQY